MTDETGAGTLRYVMHTQPELTAEDAELFFMAVVDDVTLATALIYGRDVDRYHPPPGFFTRYRRTIRVEEISYSNPWDIQFAMDATQTIVEIIGLIIAIRTTRRQDNGGRSEGDETQRQLNIARDALHGERSDRSTRRFLADAALRPEHDEHLGELQRGIEVLRERLTRDLMAVLDHLHRHDPVFDEFDRRVFAEQLADNVRLLASFERLDGVGRRVEEV